MFKKLQNSLQKVCDNHPIFCCTLNFCIITPSLLKTFYSLHYFISPKLSSLRFLFPRIRINAGFLGSFTQSSYRLGGLSTGLLPSFSSPNMTYLVILPSSSQTIWPHHRKQYFGIMDSMLEMPDLSRTTVVDIRLPRDFH